MLVQRYITEDRVLEYNYDTDMKFLGRELTVYGAKGQDLTAKEETEAKQLSNVFDINTKTRVKLTNSTPE